MVRPAVQEWGMVGGATDADLAGAMLAGDDGAFAVLYDRHVRAVHDFVARMVRDPAAAEDITQAAFIRLYERRDSLREPQKVRSWIYAVANNLAINHVTRARATEPVEERWDLAAPGRGPEGEVLARDVAELVWDAAASLEPRQYAVLDMSVRRELSTPEIAEALGVPTAHAAVLVNRAREALGNAVRYLMVARRRDHCERLQALVPAGVRALTPEQRTRVDHHMRHCDDCALMAKRLTAPAELLGGLVALPAPRGLSEWRGWTAPSVPAHDVPGPKVPRSRVRLPRPPAGLPAIAAISAVVLAVGSGVAALVVHRSPDGGGAVTTATPRGVAAAPASSAPGIATPAASPSSSAPRGRAAILVVGPGSGPMLMNVDGTGIRQVASPAFLSAALSPDGRTLAMVDVNGASMAVANADGSGLHTVFTPAPSAGAAQASLRDPTWSPAADQIAFVLRRGPTDEGIQVVNADGSGVRPVAAVEVGASRPAGVPNDSGAFCTRICSELAWSPDGAEIAYVTSGGGIAAVPVHGGAGRTILPAEGPWVRDISWSPGSSLLFDMPPAVGILEARADGSYTRTVIPDAAYSNPSWAPDGRSYLAIKSGTVVLMPASGAAGTPIGPGGVVYAQWGGPAS